MFFYYRQMSYVYEQNILTMTYSNRNNPKPYNLDHAIQGYVQEMNYEGMYQSGAELNFASFLQDKMLVIQVIRKGLPSKIFEKIKQALPFTELDWAGFLDVSSKTLQRYRQNPEKRFKSIHSEKIIELAEVTYLGKEVFESDEKFNLWLNTPCYALNNMKPVELLSDSYGKELVIDELNRIEHGVFA